MSVYVNTVFYGMAFIADTSSESSLSGDMVVIGI